MDGYDAMMAMRLKIIFTGGPKITAVIVESALPANLNAHQI